MVLGYHWCLSRTLPSRDHHHHITEVCYLACLINVPFFRKRPFAVFRTSFSNLIKI